MRCLSVILAVLFVAASAPPGSAQGGRGVPRMPMPDLPQQEPERPDRPVFRAAVTRVEVSALVLDGNGTPCAA